MAQKKGAYKYFVDIGDRMEVANARTVYVDEVRCFKHPLALMVESTGGRMTKDREAEVNKAKMTFGMSTGAADTSEEGVNASDDASRVGARVVRRGQRVCIISDFDNLTLTFCPLSQFTLQKK
jgi:ATP-dependent DNA helicase 2 subunit 1